MRLKTRLDKLETQAPVRLEVWEEDETVPGLYHHQSLTLDADALDKRACTSPGLQVIRVVMEVVG